MPKATEAMYRKKGHLLLLLLILGIAPFSASPQENQELQDYTPSTLLQKGAWEFKHFNNLYTQTASFDHAGNVRENPLRANYLSSINEFLYGVGNRMNLGLEVWVESVLLNHSPFEALTFPGGPQNRSAITGIGPRIKIAPLSSLPGFSLESTILIPAAPDLEGRNRPDPFLSGDHFQWITDLYYDHSLNDRFQFFFRFSPWLSIDRDLEGETDRFESPASVFFNWFPTDRLTFYLQNEFWPTYGTEEFISAYFLQQGIGAKYTLIPGRLELEALYTRFTLGKNAGAGMTYNIGLRLLGGP